MRRIYTQISEKKWLLATEMMQTFGGKRQILSIGSERAKMV